MPTYFARVGEHEIGFRIEHSEGQTIVRVTSPELSGDVRAEHVVDLAPVHASPLTGEGLYSLLVDSRSYQLFITPLVGMFEVVQSHHRVRLELLTEREWRLQRLAPKAIAHAGKAVVIAPMPGLVKSVLVKRGDEVVVGDRLLVLEAMKMENEITASRPGKIAEVHVSAGTVVEGGRPLVTLE